ncbi:MAG: malto-oligosyltrehalose synthase [Chloroflexota bacterium]
MRIPASTYRLQFAPSFGFEQARAVLDYLDELGVTDLYASPIFEARSGSEHGYDVVDPNRLNSELGSAADFDALIEAARRRGLGWLQDIVPNHMAYDRQNHLLMDVLENGPASPYYDFFDIDWNHPYESMKGKILAPFLGGFYGECLENGEIALSYGQSGLSIRYGSMQFPVNIESYADVIAHDLGALRKRLGADHLDFIKLLGILYTLKNIPPKDESGEREDQIVFVKRMFWELYSGDAEIKRHIDGNLSRFNGTKGKPESFNLLDRMLAQQWYRLSFWKVAAEEIDYRRFFNINELISLRMEDEKVFNHSHGLIVKLAREGKLTGLRVDHVDGLYDPLSYLERLHRAAGDVYLAVEKILGFDEELPENWPVQGTTGYEFLNFVNGLFCSRAQRRKFIHIYSRFTGSDASCGALVVEKKRLIIGKYMAGDIESLAQLLKSVSSRDRHASDVTMYGVKRALVEVLAFFPVYRSYVSPGHFSEADRARLGAAVDRAKAANAGLLLELNFIERFLLLDFAGHHSEEEKNSWTHFVMRFQQLTGPLMAKGFEDTTLYVYNRLLSLNNVGGDPDRFGVRLDEFHEFNLRRLQRWPHTINATATHDSKRGEDARARINVLSEMPEEWEGRLKIWSRINRPKKRRVKGVEVPDRNDEYFLYQTLIGSYPILGGPDADFIERLKAYIIKAVREAKVHTEWLKPDLAYETAFVKFAEALLGPSPEDRFLSEFVPFVERVAYCGMFNSLAQTLLRVAAPGLPDTYQGTELWDLSFVDPDNRRPVDFARRQSLLREFKILEAQDRPALLRDLLSEWPDGRIKLYLLHKLLSFRRDHRALFATGDYLPLEASGEMADRVCAFARRQDRSWVLAIVPRLIGKEVYRSGAPLGNEFWRGTRLPLPDSAAGPWVDAITGNILRTATPAPVKAIDLGAVFKDFPVALLCNQEIAEELPSLKENNDARPIETIA